MDSTLEVIGDETSGGNQDCKNDGGDLENCSDKSEQHDPSSSDDKEFELILGNLGKAYQDEKRKLLKQNQDLKAQIAEGYKNLEDSTAENCKLKEKCKQLEEKAKNAEESAAAKETEIKRITQDNQYLLAKIQVLDTEAVVHHLRYRLLELKAATLKAMNTDLKTQLRAEWDLLKGLADGHRENKKRQPMLEKLLAKYDPFPPLPIPAPQQIEGTQELVGNSMEASGLELPEASCSGDKTVGEKLSTNSLNTSASDPASLGKRNTSAIRDEQDTGGKKYKVAVMRRAGTWQTVRDPGLQPGSYRNSKQPQGSRNRSRGNGKRNGQIPSKK